MTRVAFYLNTETLRQVDLRDVDAGNPGIGGTEYLFFLIARHLGTSRSTVSRLIKRARDTGLVEITLRPSSTRAPGLGRSAACPARQKRAPSSAT